MKLAIASDDGLTISSHFGRTRGFIIYDLENGEASRHGYRPNTFTGHARGMAEKSQAHDHHGPILQALADCDVVVSCGMGRRIYDDLMQAGKRVFITDQVPADSAARKFVAGELMDFKERGCHGGHGHGHA